MLRLENVTVAYGKHEALHRVSLDVAPGRTTVILGANGAGKTTLLNTIAGLVRPQPGGRIEFEGRSIGAEPPHQMVAAGIALVPEGRRLFGRMTVADNLRMGAYARRARAAEERRLAFVLAMFPRLAERRGQLASTMSGGEQQMVAVARALMSGPKLLLLDEPSLGLSPLLVKDLFAALHRIKAQGQSLILVEQSVRHSLRLADYVYVLENGRIVRGGRPAEIEGDEAIRKAYLGLAGKRPPATSAAAQISAAPGPEQAHAMRRVRAAGGFRNAYARSVGAAPGAGPGAPKEKRAMTDESRFFTNTAAGFFHPFARSVGNKPMAPMCPAPVPTAASQGPHTVRREKIPTTGGFINPRAMNPQARPERL
jgi:ABC-type branched-subunit amino acid transport system ATPase component